MTCPPAAVSNPKLTGTTHNVFGIQVGVSINFFVRKKNGQRPGKIFYARTDEFWRKEQKYHFLDTHEDLSKLVWKQVKPGKNFNWLTDGMSKVFDSFAPLGTKETKATEVTEALALFKTYSRGVTTSRDAWARSFQRSVVADNMKGTIAFYNEQVIKWTHRGDKSIPVDDFVSCESAKVSWSRDLKADLQRARSATYTEDKIRDSLYRPFTKSYLFFDRVMNEEVYGFPSFIPTPETERENLTICTPGLGNRQAFGCLMTDKIPALDLAFEKAQCSPFYTYAEDGSDRRENITDWALEQFRHRYPPHSHGAPPLTKWDIFYYVYAILHHPQYRERYAANLRRELPRIPFVGEVGRAVPSAPSSERIKPGAVNTPLPATDTALFHAFVAAGKQLTDLHIGHEQAKEYPLARRENPNAQLNWRVEKMKLIKPGRTSVPASPDRPGPKEKFGLAGTLALPAPTATIIYNDFLTLEGIPPETFEHRLGNRSALEWVIDQYQASTDKRSGITNDPNRPDDPQYIVRLIAQIITVSLVTVKIVNTLPPLPQSPV